MSQLTTFILTASVKINPQICRLQSQRNSQSGYHDVYGKNTTYHEIMGFIYFNIFNFLRNYWHPFFEFIIKYTFLNKYIIFIT